MHVGLCIVADRFWYRCLFGLLASVTGGVSTYVREMLAIGRRGYTGRDLTFKRRIKSHLPFAGIIRSSPYSPGFQDKG